MEKTTKQKMMESLVLFGRLYQLEKPTQEYFEALRSVLHSRKWRLSEFNKVLNILLKDDKYAELARFGKYPTINDFFRIKQKIDNKPFTDALSLYLSGCYWEKENVLTLATPAQLNAIEASGGLSAMYSRANGNYAIPVEKIVDSILVNESVGLTKNIDTNHRIGGPNLLKIENRG